jgi:hypothetical protein
MTEPDPPPPAERLARELEEGAAVLEAAGNETWPQRLREERMRLLRTETVDLDHLAESIFGASEALLEIDHHAEAYQLGLGGIIDVMIIRRARRGDQQA